MSTSHEPNPPSRKGEDFPKTNTIPDGWVMDALMEYYNGDCEAADADAVHPADAASDDQQAIPVPATGSMSFKVNGKSHPVETVATAPTDADCDNLFTRRLEPFPSAWDLTGMWL